ncbi:MAG: hypothetical protein ACI4LM_03235 [Anaerovoracaceae bacterium]|jgi:1,4-dihydroxy-2-naphthoate octaprenyltransferase
MSKKNTDNNSIVKKNMKTLNRLSIIDCIVGTLFLIGAFLYARANVFSYALIMICMSAAFLGLAGMYRYRYKNMKDRHL